MEEQKSQLTPSEAEHKGDSPGARAGDVIPSLSKLTRLGTKEQWPRVTKRDAPTSRGS